MSAQCKVAAVVVSYNTCELLRACIESLLRARDAGEIGGIVVVDSGSRDRSVEVARSLLPDEAVISVPNRGYGAAANVGIEAASAPYVLVLNGDTVVLPGAAGTLARCLDTNPSVAVAGPRLRYPDGSVQSSRRRFPTRLTPLFESTIVEEWWPGNRWVRSYRMMDVPDDESQVVDWIVGAAMMVRQETVARVGGFDESFRMYSEETEWCWRFRQHGWRVMYVPDAEVVHHEGASSAQDVPSRQREFDMSRVRLMERLYGRRHAAIVRCALLAGYVAYVLREGSKWLAGHRRDLRGHRVQFYLRLLRSGLRPAQEERP